MDEILIAYGQDGTVIKLCAKEVLLKEIKEYSLKHSDAPFAVGAVHIMLSNSNGGLYIVKRSSTDDENPGLYCKTVGGHLIGYESFGLAAIRETKEEIDTSLIVTTIRDYPQVLNLEDTANNAVVRLIDFQPWMKSVRKDRDGSSWVKRLRVTIYAGVYNGPVEFSDGEAEGMKLIDKHKLRGEIRSSPELFTYDLDQMVERYFSYF
ncbi:MAG: NUDIX domain-containing protein [Candidatus Woesearchaeota archaeon]